MSHLKPCLVKIVDGIRDRKVAADLRGEQVEVSLVFCMTNPSLLDGV